MAMMMSVSTAGRALFGGNGSSVSNVGDYAFEEACLLSRTRRRPMGAGV